MTNANYAVDPFISKVKYQGLNYLTLPFINRMKLEGKSTSTISTYTRTVSKLIKFYNKRPADLEIDQVIHFMVNMTEQSNLTWKSCVKYVAGLRYYWTHILNDPEFANRIPYPKRQQTLPEILSREELRLLFDACNNIKHRTMFRLIYGSGLRSSELTNLKMEHVDISDGKCRILVRKGKGNKDRYTVLSKNVLEELQEYCKKYQPKVYLFNGHVKGEKIGGSAIRDAIKRAQRKSGITKRVTTHVLRHCFATHALEHGMNIKRVQMLMGHSSLWTTISYLQVSEIPLNDDFSPLDCWDDSIVQKGYVSIN